MTKKTMPRKTVAVLALTANLPAAWDAPVRAHAGGLAGSSGRSPSGAATGEAAASARPQHTQRVHDVGAGTRGQVGVGSVLPAPASRIYRPAAPHTRPQTTHACKPHPQADHTRVQTAHAGRPHPCASLRAARGSGKERKRDSTWQAN